jgi:Coenzyme PQQ synthesis protein D (PqqD)
MQTTSRFKVNEKLVTSKIIDGEAIIINLANGMYYSLEKTGALVWMLIGGRYSVGECADVVAARFSIPVERVRVDVDRLVNDLVNQNLVLAAGTDTRTIEVVLDPAAGDAYEPPVLNTYDDMGDVLALDPPLPQVEVDNESWETNSR